MGLITTTKKDRPASSSVLFYLRVFGLVAPAAPATVASTVGTVVTRPRAYYARVHDNRSRAHDYARRTVVPRTIVRPVTRPIISVAIIANRSSANGYAGTNAACQHST